MKYQFKTNIMCGSCIAKITPAMEANKEIISWEVNVQDSHKILTVETETISEEKLISMVKDAGYKAEPLN